MFFIINDKEYALDNDYFSVDKIMTIIDEAKALKDKVFSHLVIDDIEVYNEFEDYLKEHVTTVEKIEAVIYTIKEHVHQLLLSTENYLMSMIPELEKIVEQFYQGSTQETWNSFNLFLQGLQWINQMIENVERCSYQPENWNDFIFQRAAMESKLKDLEEAVVANDTVLIADILQYEFIESIGQIKESVAFSIDNEGVRSDVN
ncbi:hypothetical protein GCM10011391_13790 [Pullulanibacillus camelliae]|uniref:Uncharacterized protein n=1 Tax=Pullulanibacillus camelliae TaxID=1707096 RepID=A0A8J2VLE0_9BACL|nr:hypothetical protein [Pullulanibacillus camelliae]GGE36227.1 hypothetical protein GCM10011391_13790 [Pullulanibacillus camelliae]